MAIDLAILANLSSTDPRGYGFRPLINTAHGGTRTDWTQYQEVVDLWNLVRDGTNPPTTPTADGGQASGIITIREESISTKAIFEATLIADFPAIAANPTATQLSTERRYLAWLTWLFSQESIRLLNDNGTDTPVVPNLNQVFPTGTPSRTRINALAQRSGSYAEEKFGRGTVLTRHDLVRAFGEL